MCRLQMVYFDLCKPGHTIYTTIPCPSIGSHLCRREAPVLASKKDFCPACTRWRRLALETHQIRQAFAEVASLLQASERREAEQRQSEEQREAAEKRKAVERKRRNRQFQIYMPSSDGLRLPQQLDTPRWQNGYVQDQELQALQRQVQQEEGDAPEYILPSQRAGRPRPARPQKDPSRPENHTTGEPEGQWPLWVQHRFQGEDDC